MSTEAKVVIGVLAWILGSAAMNGLLGTFVPRPLLDYLIMLFVIGWGVACFWLARHL